MHSARQSIEIVDLIHQSPNSMNSNSQSRDQSVGQSINQSNNANQPNAQSKKRLKVILKWFRDLNKRSALIKQWSDAEMQIFLDSTNPVDLSILKVEITNRLSSNVDAVVVMVQQRLKSAHNQMLIDFKDSLYLFVEAITEDNQSLNQLIRSKIESVELVGLVDIVFTHLQRANAQLGNTTDKESRVDDTQPTSIVKFLKQGSIMELIASIKSEVVANVIGESLSVAVVSFFVCTDTANDAQTVNQSVILQSIDVLVDQSNDCSVDRSNDQTNDQSVDQSNHHSVDQSVEHIVTQSSNQSVDQPNDQPADHSADQSNEFHELDASYSSTPNSTPQSEGDHVLDSSCDENDTLCVDCGRHISRCSKCLCEASESFRRKHVLAVSKLHSINQNNPSSPKVQSVNQQISDETMRALEKLNNADIKTAFVLMYHELSQKFSKIERQMSEAKIAKAWQDGRVGLIDFTNLIVQLLGNSVPDDDINFIIAQAVIHSDARNESSHALRYYHSYTKETLQIKIAKLIKQLEEDCQEETLLEAFHKIQKFIDAKLAANQQVKLLPS